MSHPEWEDTFDCHRFNHRILIPVFNAEGEIIGFGGRALCSTGSCVARYIDTVGKNWFNRGETLYGTHLALELGNKFGELYLFEGYFDVILAHQAGLQNSAAVLGTYLRKSGFADLRKVFPRGNIKLCYDDDDAGHRAAQKSSAELNCCDVEIFHLKDYKDPAVLFQVGEHLIDHLVRVN